MVILIRSFDFAGETLYAVRGTRSPPGHAGFFTLTKTKKKHGESPWGRVIGRSNEKSSFKTYI